MSSLLCIFFNFSFRFIFSSNKALQSTLSHDVVICTASSLSTSSSLTTWEIICFFADVLLQTDVGVSTVQVGLVLFFGGLYGVFGVLLTGCFLLALDLEGSVDVLGLCLKAGRLRGWILSWLLRNSDGCRYCGLSFCWCWEILLVACGVTFCFLFAGCFLLDGSAVLGLYDLKAGRLRG